MPILQASDIHKAYHPAGQAPTVVLRGANLSCEPGEFMAIVGPSGAGKSTLLHILASLDDPDSGTVTIWDMGKGLLYSECSPQRLAKVRNDLIGMVFQFHHLLPEFTAIENVMMPSLVAGDTTAVAREKAIALMDRMGVQERAEHMPSELSGGEQQRVALARALVNEPRILFADEPTGNLDTANATIVADLISELQLTMGIACIVATHSTELSQRAHRIVSMRDGQVFDESSA